MIMLYIPQERLGISFYIYLFLFSPYKEMIVYFYSTYPICLRHPLKLEVHSYPQALLTLVHIQQLHVLVLQMKIVC